MGFTLIGRWLAIIALLCVCAGRAAGAADRGVLVPIFAFVAAANSGDRAKLVGAFSSDSAIVDEFAPFRFPAPNAAGHWFDGFAADQTANGVSAAVIAVRPPKFMTVAGRHAYVVVPTVYTYRIHGAPAKETGSLAFSLVESGTRWKISTMSWAKLTDTSVP